MPDMREDEIEGVVADAQDDDAAARATDTDDASDDLESRASSATHDGHATGEPIPPQCQFVCGRAGTGKSYWAKQQIAQDPTWGRLCATTGISAVNLDTITINSALKYFDTASLEECYMTGQLRHVLIAIGQQYRRVLIDEISMMDARQLDLIYRATSEANASPVLRGRPLGLVVIGDFAQLPPVKAQWAFRATCWPKFAAATTRLTHIWRQEQREFLDALEAARRGDGETAAAILTSVGIQWHSAREVGFPGTTILGKNDEVDRHNNVELDRSPQRLLTFPSKRWAVPAGEVWGGKWKLIPQALELKDSAYVMILTNHREFAYANGDCGYVRAVADDAITVELVRNGAMVSVPRLTRSITSKEKPRGWSESMRTGVASGAYYPHMHRDDKRRYVTGQVNYFPLRLAWASTVHKSQGLSLDRIQLDFRQSFLGQPAMLYTALSRCRTLEGLRMVGDRERFVTRCNRAYEVEAWL